MHIAHHVNITVLSKFRHKKGFHFFAKTASGFCFTEYRAPSSLSVAQLNSQKIKARLHIAPYTPKPKCVSGTICMKWNCAYAKTFAAVPGPVFPGHCSTATISLHTTVYPYNRRSMISGILSARHTGSLAFRLQKILFSDGTRALPQVLRHIKFYKKD